MAYDMFLKLDGIPGESTDDKHKGEIVVQSFSWGESNAGAHSLGSGAGAGKVSFQDFHFTAQVSKASPVLMLHCANGKHIPNGLITVRKADSENRGGSDFLFYKLTDVLISSISQAGDVNDRPLESVSMAFAKVNVEYKPQKADGSLDAAVTFAWDLKANKKA